MTLRRFVPALTLALVACGPNPGATGPDRILVVPATAAREATPTARAAPTEAAMSPTRHASTLTVEESARINTSEMWSEPIAADAEEIVIE